jgi:hypothetical protein
MKRPQEMRLVNPARLNVDALQWLFEVLEFQYVHVGFLSTELQVPCFCLGTFRSLVAPLPHLFEEPLLPGKSGSRPATAVSSNSDRFRSSSISHLV